MRIYGDINRVGPDPRDFVVQVGPTPEVGLGVVTNGKFLVDIPDGSPVPTTIPNTLAGLLDPIYDGLLVGTRYNFVQYNALLSGSGSDSNKLDMTATFPFEPGPPARYWSCRAQVGRFGAPANNGLAPNSVKVLEMNGGVVPPRPGLLITDTIDISSDVPAGVSSFQVYWKILSTTTSDDVMNYVGGTNSPAIRTVAEVPQEPTTFEVYASTNDGAGYSRVSRMTPVTTCDVGSKLRLAFVNKGTNPVYLAAYAVLY